MDRRSDRRDYTFAANVSRNDSQDTQHVPKGKKLAGAISGTEQGRFGLPFRHSLKSERRSIVSNRRSEWSFRIRCRSIRTSC